MLLLTCYFFIQIPFSFFVNAIEIIVRSPLLDGILI